jgi:hypothetical protein
MKKVFSIWSMVVLTTLCVGFSSCSDDDDEEGDDTKKFSELLVGKWQYYAYVNDGWNIVEDGDYIQFNSDGTLSFSDYKTWEVMGKGSRGYGEYGDSYKVVLKGHPTDDDEVWDIGIIGKSIDYPMGKYDYPDVLSVSIGYRQYMFIRVK